MTALRSPTPPGRALGRRRARSGALVLLAPLAALAIATSCTADAPDLVVYTSMNQVHSEPVIQRFERETGLDVLVEFDTEANKTVGLTRRLREEAAGGVHRCDVFWNNEVANTVALAQEGLLQPYRSPAAEGIDARWHGAGDLYTGFAARARVIIANTELIDPSTLSGLDDLFRPEHAGKAAFVKPVTGTTLTHVTVLHVALGEERGREFVDELEAAVDAGAVRLYPGNMVVARAVARGEAAFGFTDVNDFRVVAAEGAPVVQIVPDQGEGQMGAVMLPNTIGILAGSKHVENARRFVDFMVSAENERLLAETNSQSPLHPGVPMPDDVIDPHAIKLLPIDFAALGRRLPSMLAEMQERFVD